MELTREQIQTLRIEIDGALATLRQENIAPDLLTEFVPAKKWFIFGRKPKFVEISPAWRLGVFLISPAGELFKTGETTRAVPPGYPGHTSKERERRRDYIRAAFESGFKPGQVLFFNSPKIPLTPETQLPVDSPLVTSGNEVLVRWNKGVPDTAATPFKSYIHEQVGLRIATESNRNDT